MLWRVPPIGCARIEGSNALILSIGPYFYRYIDCVEGFKRQIRLIQSLFSPFPKVNHSKEPHIWVSMNSCEASSNKFCLKSTWLECLFFVEANLVQPGVLHCNCYNLHCHALPPPYAVLGSSLFLAPSGAFPMAVPQSFIEYLSNRIGSSSPNLLT